MKGKRDPNLDLLRALAIVMVIVFHLSVMWPVRRDFVSRWGSLGEHGVTLFFVLSGWLIGNIYWKELKAKGRIRLTEFWLKRWLRTIPPYIAGFALAFCSAFALRGDAFDWNYVFFLQNYQSQLVLYKISWSLCVEEHFYLALPLIGWMLSHWVRIRSTVVILLPLLPMFLRMSDPWAGPSETFGYAKTATHLVFEGMAFGVLGSYLNIYFHHRWLAFQSIASRFWILAIAIFLSSVYWEPSFEYYLGHTLIAFIGVSILAAVAARKPLPFATSPAVYYVAITSYSTYLTHSLVLHVGRKLTSADATVLMEVVTLPMWLLLIMISGVAFYFCIERPTIQLRAKLLREAVKVESALPPTKV